MDTTGASLLFAGAFIMGACLTHLILNRWGALKGLIIIGTFLVSSGSLLLIIANV